MMVKITERQQAILDAVQAIEDKMMDVADDSLTVEFQFTNVTSDGDPVVDFEISRMVIGEGNYNTMEVVGSQSEFYSFGEALVGLVETIGILTKNKVIG